MSQPRIVQIVIVYQEGQPLQVSGPLQDRILCYGLLEMAKDIIRDFKPPQIIPAPADLLQHLNRNGHEPSQ